MVESLHFLNGCLVVPALLGVALFLFRQHRAGKGLTPASTAAMLLVGLMIFAQVYLGISLLSNRGQRSMLHYSLGVLPLLLLLISFWVLPQLKARAALGAGIAFGIAAVLAALAYIIG